jgi:DNA repair protein RecN (Recombination protein N)
MIRSLSIQNYAIIDELEIRFPDGLTIITGETGAGKSILLGALGLIMGKRADTKALYDLERKCIIEARFDVSKYRLQSFFEDNDIDYEEELFVRRELTPSGKSRAFVNDTPVTLHVLQELSAALIDLHQQFDTLDIHQVSFQLRMVDALANNLELLERYNALYRNYQRDRRRLEELRAQHERAVRELDFLQFQHNELEEAQLQPGEQEALEAEEQVLSHAEDIKRSMTAAYLLLSEQEFPVLGQLQELQQRLQPVRKFHPELPELLQRLSTAIVDLEDLAGELERIGESTEFDPLKIQEIQQRLDLLNRLQHKHQVANAEALIELKADFERQIQSFGELADETSELEAALQRYEEELTSLAIQLRERRMSVIPSFEAQVVERLSMLSMESARLQIELRPLTQLSASGLDEVHFLFAANKGGRLQEIKDVASGGELSRLTLVTKSLVASAIPLPTLIFDEIDTGISGDVALKMGHILRELSNQHQVVSITHSPQVASKADAHYFVYKQETEKRTLTRVRELNKEERIRAIAVMLSQNPPTESALDNARELLQL